MDFFLEAMDSLRLVTPLSVAVRIFAAVVIGGIIGLERGLKNRPAGLRTYMLVCTGACVVMLTNQYIYQGIPAADPTRLAAQVVSGIGFLGAGTIIVTRRNQIKGLTTAAGLWSAAGIGIALGVGFYEAALVGTAAIFTVMTLLQRWDNRMHRKTRLVEVYLELDTDISLGDFLRAIRARNMEIQDIQHESGLQTQNDGKHRAYIAMVKSNQRRLHLDILEDVRQIPGVVYVEEL